MGWDYNYLADGTALDTYCESVRILDEVGASKRGSNIVVPYLHGEWSEYKKWFNAVPFGLECVLRYTNASGAVTHTDGAPGHVYENLAALKQIFGKRNTTVTLTRDTPHQGTNRADVEVLEEIHSVGPRHKYLIICRMVNAFWRETPAEQDVETGIATSRSYTIDTGGNAPIGDMVITFDINANTTGPRLALVAGNDFVKYVGDLVNTDQVVFDVGARTVTKNGSNAAANLQIGTAWWMEFPSDTTGLQLSATATAGTDWDVTIDWNNKWH
jgi:hypothetical protein